MQKHEREAWEAILEVVEPAGMSASIVRKSKHMLVEIVSGDGFRTSFPVASSPRADAQSQKNFARQKAARAVRMLQEREADGIIMHGEGTVRSGDDNG